MSKPEMSVDEKLCLFGNSVLKILETTPEWSSDTTDEIATIAADLGLSGTNEYGEFISLVDRQENPRDGE